jgi:hypothetical protein
MIFKRISSYDFSSKISEEENEDAIGIFENSNFNLFAMSDGAGGAGIYCKEWANHIVNNQPEFPILSNEEGNKWFKILSKSFYDFIKPKINYDNLFIGDRFDREGSYATLLYLWVSKTEKKYYLSGIGDTTLFHFKKTNGDYFISLVEPISKQSSLDNNPELLNWQKTLEYLLASKSVDYENGDTIIIATDSLSRRIIYQLINIDEKNTKNCLNETLVKNLRSDFIKHINETNKMTCVKKLVDYLRKLINMDIASFRDELKIWVDRNELEKDDYSLIIIDL